MFASKHFSSSPKGSLWKLDVGGGPALYQKKPSYDDMAKFVYSLLSVIGTSMP